MPIHTALMLLAFAAALYILRLEHFRREDWQHVSVDLAFALFRLLGYIGAVEVAIGIGYGGSPLETWTLEVASQIGVRDFLASHKVIAFFALLAWTSYFGYWFHRLLHKIDAMWELHKVHHSATRMTGLSWLRMHPIDEVFTGYLFAILTCILLPELGPRTSTIYGIFIALHLIATHSEWRASWGWWSWIFISPAAHQVHHSTNPKHFNSNFGSPFSIWDRLHGTYIDPLKTEAPTSFGVEGISPTDPKALLLEPVVRCIWRLLPQRIRGIRQS